MGYPLVPGYESVGRVVEAGSCSGFHPGQRVFVPGAKCFGEVRGLFGASASRLVVPAKRVVPIDQQLGERGILLALAATAYHAIAAKGASAPDCIVGHGVLGRLLARISIALRNEPPTVWEKNPARAGGAAGYGVIDPEHDARRDYKNIYDVSGDAGLLDSLIGRIASGGEIVLAGFYSERLSFAFPPAFMREARLRVAAEWQQSDLAATRSLIESGRLSLDGLISHRQAAGEAPEAYSIAFNDPSCLKMVLDWSSLP
jgi:3-hydroxyethyl bacteriochlorophyllide a dehydrogenase